MTQIKHNKLRIPVGGFIHSVEELNLGSLKTNPFSDREEDLNMGHLDYNSSALPLGHAHLLSYQG